MTRTPKARAERIQAPAQAPRAAEAFRIFISYCHVDERFREALDRHLSPLLLLGRVETWHDRHIQAGSRLYETIQGNIETAHIVLMLVSADYLHSKSCQSEMSIALKNSDEGTAVAIPIVVRACNWTILPIGTLLAANEDGKPINSQADPDVAWTQVAKKIGEIINDWEVQRSTEQVADEGAPASAAGEDQQALQRTASGERWINRREDNDTAWAEVIDGVIDSLASAARADNGKSNVGLNIRTWGEKIIVDFTLPQRTTARRLLIRDIGGYVNHPGYQLEIYSADDSIKYSRVRWLLREDGARVLRPTMPSAGPEADMSVQEFAQSLWSKIASQAKPRPAKAASAAKAVKPAAKDAITND